MLRFLRLAACIVSLTACVLFAALWVRSQFWQDGAVRRGVDSYQHFASRNGVVSVLYVPMTFGLYVPTTSGENLPITFNSTPMERVEVIVTSARRMGHWVSGTPQVWGFGVRRLAGGGIELMAPHWLFVLLTGAAAFALEPAPRRKFNLRELLIVTTIFALVLGGMATLSRLAD